MHILQTSFFTYHDNWSYYICSYGFQEMIDEFEIYFLLFDRAGYGESDPHPSRTLKTDTYDIEELADKLRIGPKFHVLGMSLGAYPVYGCLKYIPHRYINLLQVESKNNIFGQI